MLAKLVLAALVRGEQQVLVAGHYVQCQSDGDVWNKEIGHTVLGMADRAMIMLGAQTPIPASVETRETFTISLQDPT